MRRFRSWLADKAFDLAAWIHPTPHCRMVGQAHHVGKKWLTWEVHR
jgi:hypothetical protein